MLIGKIKLRNKIIAAPMAGVSDYPFREICISKGAAVAIAEMQSSNPKVRETKKSKSRVNLTKDTGIKWIQIAGSDPEMMADAAKYNLDLGADIIDINMGCPAKKVNKNMAGSALMQHPLLVEKIITKVVNAVKAPVTLKMRTGWSKDNKNALEIAKIAINCGVQAITVHGRTKEDLFRGQAEYETVKNIKQQIEIPVIANGDINTPEQAKYVMQYTKADAIMIGRAAQGNPWIFDNIKKKITNESKCIAPDKDELKKTILKHINLIYDFYGEEHGVLFARKHVNWYLTKNLHGKHKMDFNKIKSSAEQISFLETKV